MLPLKQKIAAIPEGAGAFFFIQTFATLGFAVLYSTLVLYATKKLNFSAKDATAIMGVFGAFNYGLHLKTAADPEKRGLTEPIYLLQKLLQVSGKQPCPTI